MKKIIILIVLVLAGFAATAQIDPLYSQYLFNGLVLNPAYAGSKDAPSGVAFYRKSFYGFDGAPNTSSISYHTPLPNQKIAIGANITNDVIGLINNTSATISGAYRIISDRGTFSMGLSGNVNQFVANFGNVQTGLANGSNSTDPAFAGQNTNIISPNVGIGFYYYNERNFIGLSVPNIIESNIDARSTTSFNKVTRSYRGTAGHVFNLSPEWDYKLSTSTRFTYGSPFNIDVNHSFIYNESIIAGVSNRNLDVLAFMLQVRFAKTYWVGVAKDFAINKTTNYVSGGFEFFVGFDLNPKGSLIQSPRYF